MLIKPQHGAKGILLSGVIEGKALNAFISVSGH